MKNVVGLFAGIGGFEAGLAPHGFHASVLCEVDPSARTVLRHRFPDATIEEDVTTMTGIPADTDMVVGGFPCQDLSTIGGKKGISGERSGLLSEIFRLLATRRVETVILENVPNIINLDNGSGMRAVADGFEALGYSWAYRVLDTRAFGIPQKRRRVYIVASLTADPRDILLSDDVILTDMPPVTVDKDIGFYWTEGRYGASVLQESVPTLKGGSAVGIPSPPAILFTTGNVGTPDIRDAERLQGFEAGWTEPAENLARGARWKMVGNAISVPVVSWVGGKVVNPSLYDASGDAEMKPGAKWPKAAWGVGGKRFVSTVGEWPVSVPGPAIADFLLHPVKPLSLKATSGFAARVEASGVRYPVGFLEKIQAYKDRIAA